MKNINKSNPLRRNIRIESFLTRAEKEIFDSQLSLYGLSQAELIRWSLFNKEISFRSDDVTGGNILKSILAEYGKTGSNLNQIAHHLNGGGELTADTLYEIRKELSALSDLSGKLLKIYEGIRRGDGQTYFK